MSKKNNTTKTQKYQALTEQERGIIYGMKIKGATQQEIAEEIGKNQSTICRELKRGSVEQLDTHRRKYIKYFADSGQRVCEENKKKRKFITLDKYKNFITAFEKEMLESKYRIYSIDTFVNEYKKKHPDEKVPCTKTVYNWVDKCYLKTRNIDLPVKTRRKETNATPKPKGTNKKRLGTSIDKRDEIVLAKIEKGHFEADLVLGKKGKHEQAILTVVDIATRVAYVTKVRRDSVSVYKGMEHIIREIGEENIKTITTDNGSEFSDFVKLENNYDIKVYYTHAYSAWEKGTNERFNGMLREFLPKGRSVNNVTEDMLNQMVTALNNRPRKVLGYKTPMEVQEII